jgi:uroporphyrinogen decarboxylase
MIAGGSSDESIDIRRFAYTNPEDLDALFEVLVEATTAYLIAQLEAGADALQIFESWAATIPASQVDKFSIDPIRRIIDGVRRHAPSVPVIVFPRGAGSAYPRYAAQTGATALSVDTQTSLAWLRRQVGPSMALQGNLDPLALIAGGEPLRQAVAGFHRETAGTPQIFNLGHGIRPETPIAHVEQLLKLLREPA